MALPSEPSIIVAFDFNTFLGEGFNSQDEGWRIVWLAAIHILPTSTSFIALYVFVQLYYRLFSDLFAPSTQSA